MIKQLLRMVQTESAILVRKKGFQITFLLLLLYALGISVYYAWQQQGQDVSILYAPAMAIGLGSDSDYLWMLMQMFPFLAVLPAGFSYYVDQKCGISVFKQARGGKGLYDAAKLISAFAVTFLAFTLPFVLELILNVIIFPLDATKALTGWATYSNTYIEYAENFLFSPVFFQNIYLYTLCEIIKFGLFAGCAAVFITGISSFRFRYPVFLLLPLYLGLYVEYLIAYRFLSFQTYLNYYLSAFDIDEDKKIGYFLILMLGLLVIGIGCTVFNGKRKKEYL